MTHSILATFAIASFLGVVLISISTKYRISAIVLLLSGGVLAGPEMLNIISPETLGKGLQVIVSIAVALILFEGGLTLDVKGYKKVSSEVKRILSWGVLITWFMTTVLIKIFFNFDWQFSLLTASLIIVTGPTVIGPMLQRIKIKKNLHHILHWEGVMIDPIGVFIALLCYEWFITTVFHEATLNFLLRFIVGFTLGILFGHITFTILKKEWIQEHFINIFIVSTVILNFAAADILIHESGLLSVVVAGLYLGYRKTPRLESIIQYKVELKDYMIGLLFILLAANLSLEKFIMYGITLPVVALCVIYVVRPANIFLSLIGSRLSIKEKLFLSWISPRGIVAASMASLFTYRLKSSGFENADFLEAFTYTIIASTIVIQGFSAGWAGKHLNVLEPKPDGWLIVGAHKIGRAVADFLSSLGKQAVLIDTNAKNIKLANTNGLNAYFRNAKELDPDSQAELIGIGNILAITENEELNQLICTQWKKISRQSSMYFWASGNIKTPTAGIQIWKGLDLKASTSEPSLPKKLKLQSVTDITDLFKTGDCCLFSSDGTHIIPELPENFNHPIQCLVEENIRSAFSIPVKKEWILFYDGNTIKELYKVMMDTLHKDFPTLNSTELLDEILDREKEFTNLIGHGISLPHLYSDQISESIFMMARLTPPVPCSYTKENISMVFFILSPVNNQIEHLNLISRIARFLMSENNLNALLQADNVNTVYSLFLKEFENHGRSENTA